MELVTFWNDKNKYNEVQNSTLQKHLYSGLTIIYIDQ